MEERPVRDKEYHGGEDDHHYGESHPDKLASFFMDIHGLKI
jgi:hypothetical protein